MGQGPPPVPWAAVILGPDLTWSNYVAMYATPSKEDQVKVAGFQQRAPAEIQAQWAANRPGQKKVSEMLSREIKDFTDQNLSGLTVGNYFVLLLAYDENSRTPVIAKCFSFSLSPQDIGILSLVTEQYRTLSPLGPAITLALREVDDGGTIIRVKKDAGAG